MSVGRLVLKANDGLYWYDNATNTPTELIDADDGEWVGPVGPGAVVPADITLTGLSVPGRSAATTGAAANLAGTADQVLRVNTAGTALGFGTIAAGSIASNAVTTAKILDANVTYAKIADGAGTSIIGKATTGAGVNADITGTDGQILRVSGTTVGFGSILPANITGAGTSIVGKATTGSGANADITGTNGQALRVSGTTVGFGTLASAAYAANSVNSAAMDDNLLHYATGSLSSAQVLALSTTAVELVAAPGVNKILVLDSLLLQYVYVTTAYTIGSATNLQVKYTDNSGAAASGTQAVTGFLDQASNQVRLMRDNPTSITPVANARFALALAGADVTGGVGTISYFITYRIHTVA